MHSKNWTKESDYGIQIGSKLGRYGESMKNSSPISTSDKK